MDRGVKIAIFVASVVSLSLGLIWDQVLSQAREAVEQRPSDPMGPETMHASVGSPDIERMELVKAVQAGAQAAVDAAPAPAATTGNTAQQPAVTPDDKQFPEVEYEVVANDNWWAIANRKFQERGWSSSDLEKYNNGVKLVAGKKIKIPAGKKPK